MYLGQIPEANHETTFFLLLNNTVRFIKWCHTLLEQSTKNLTRSTDLLYARHELGRRIPLHGIAWSILPSILHFLLNSGTRHWTGHLDLVFQQVVSIESLLTLAFLVFEFGLQFVGLLQRPICVRYIFEKLFLGCFAGVVCICRVWGPLLRRWMRAEATGIGICVQIVLH